MRGDRHRRGVVRRADRPAGPAGVGGARRGAARDPGLRRQLRLGVAEHLGRGVPRRGARDDARGLPARVPAGRRELPQRRPRPGGGRAQPRRRAPADVLADHARPGPRGDPRRLPARRARAAGRVRRVRDPRLPDVHDRDLHRVQRLLQRPDGLRAVARARAAQPARALRREPRRAGSGPRQPLGSARAARRRAPPPGPRTRAGARRLPAARRARARRAGRRERLLDPRGRTRATSTGVSLLDAAWHTALYSGAAPPRWRR